MITVNKIEAIAIPLAGEAEAVLVQDGPEWNGLRKFKCIAPPDMIGAVIIATEDRANSPFSAMFGELFQIGYVKWVAVMASPALEEYLKPKAPAQ